MVGAGIFVSTPRLAAQHGAPSLLAGYLVAALACGLTALCYAEFAGIEPGGGSAYAFARRSWGNWTAWMVAGALLLEYCCGAAAVAVLWTGGQAWGGLAVLIATALIAAGIRLSAGVNGVLVALKVGTLLALIGHVGVSQTWQGLAGPVSNWPAVAGPAVFSFLGFESVSTLGLESRNPSRNLSIGILGSLAITTVLYLAVIAAYGTMMPPEAEGLAGIAAGTPLLPKLVQVCITAGLSTVLLVMLLGISRIAFSMAADGTLPKIFAATRGHSPVGAVLITGALTAVLCVALPPDSLYDLAVAGTLLAFLAVSSGLLSLRSRGVAGPFRAPAGRWVASAATLVNFYILAQTAPRVGIPLAGFAVTWAAVYAFRRK